MLARLARLCSFAFWWVTFAMHPYNEQGQIISASVWPRISAHTCPFVRFIGCNRLADRYRVLSCECASMRNMIGNWRIAFSWFWNVSPASVFFESDRQKRNKASLTNFPSQKNMKDELIPHIATPIVVTVLITRNYRHYAIDSVISSFLFCRMWIIIIPICWISLFNHPCFSIFMKLRAVARIFSICFSSHMCFRFRHTVQLIRLGLH